MSQLRKLLSLRHKKVSQTVVFLKYFSDLYFNNNDTQYENIHHLRNSTNHAASNNHY
jgi:hypothetical protein